MLEWTPEAIDAEMSYRNELRKIREAQGIYGRPVPVVPWWRRKPRSKQVPAKRVPAKQARAKQARAKDRSNASACTSAQTR